MLEVLLSLAVRKSQVHNGEEVVASLLNWNFGAIFDDVDRIHFVDEQKKLSLAKASCKERKKRGMLYK